MLKGLAKNIENKCLAANKVLVVTHAKPDADALGSALALKFWLDSSGREVVIACKDKPTDTFDFLPSINYFVTEFDLSSFDLVVVVDCGASHLTEFELVYPDFLCSSSERQVINIDHHASNDGFGDLNYINPVAASTTIMIYDFFNELGFSISPEIATCLLAGIYGDTGGFMHSNTSGEVLRISSELMVLGADYKSVSSSLSVGRSINTLKLWGRALEKLTISPDKIAISVLKDEDYKDTEASPNDLTGLVDYLNMVPDTKFALLLNEDGEGNVKGSFRTRNEDINLSDLAAKYGGGGHPKASGFKLPGKLKGDTKFEIVSGERKHRSLKF